MPEDLIARDLLVRGTEIGSPKNRTQIILEGYCASDSESAGSSLETNWHATCFFYRCCSRCQTSPDELLIHCSDSEITSIETIA
jgi:hypothetical protein